MELLKKIKRQAKRNPQRIVFPESTEPRILRAVLEIARFKYAKPILVGSKSKIEAKLRSLKLLPIYVEVKKRILIVDPEEFETDRYAVEMCRIRRKKGWKMAQCKKLVKDPLYFGTMMVKMNDADGMIAGAVTATSDTIRPALQLIKTKKRFHRVSGVFLMDVNGKYYVFADCVVNIDPDAKTLAEIAIDSANTAEAFGLKPVVALLSFSTKGSADHPSIKKIRQAVKIVKKKRPDLAIDGELQVDAAIVPKVCAVKSPDSPVCGISNVLIFPTLAVGNISYKLVERLAGANAVGPLLQGLALPVNDLSRGCSVQNIIDLAAITSVQAQHARKQRKMMVPQ